MFTAYLENRTSRVIHHQLGYLSVAKPEKRRGCACPLVAQLTQILMAPTEFKLSDIRGTDEEEAHVEWILAHLFAFKSLYMK